MTRQTRQTSVIEVDENKSIIPVLITTQKMLQDGFDQDYADDLKSYRIKKDAYDENKHKAYALIFSNCSKIMQHKIEETSDFEIIIRDDLLELLKEIKTKMYTVQKSKYDYVTLTETLDRFLNTKQEDNENMPDYTTRFKQVKDMTNQ